MDKQITAKRMKEIVTEWRQELGLSEGRLYVSLTAKTLADCLKFGVEAGDRLARLDSGGVIYSRNTVNEGGLWAWAQINITADNYAELPTEALRQKARKLLGLPEPAPEYSSGVVELGVQG